MHEIRVDVPEGAGAAIAEIARAAGIERATLVPARDARTGARRELVSVETSTPRAKAFLDALLASDRFDPAACPVTSRELRAIADGAPLCDLTRPGVEPGLDVIEDLWQLSHVTPSYVGRAAGAAILLAHGMLQGSAIAIVVAALFLPFLSQVLAVGIGLATGERALARHGALALAVSTTIAVAAGVLVASASHAPLAFGDFQPPLVGFAISSVIGVAAGLGVTDDAGRRYLIGVAAAVQYSIFPVWVGIAIVRGFPPADVTRERLATFAINLVTIAAVAALAFAVASVLPRFEAIRAARNSAPASRRE
jgi:uncharacterized protein DUF389